MNAIETRNLTKKFDEFVAIHNLNLEVQKGEVFGLLGPDGAGKTTLMRLLACLLTPTSGDGWVCGKALVKESESIKEKIGYMSQHFGLYEDLTVIENLQFFADLFSLSKEKKKTKIGHLLEFSRLTKFQKRLAGNLSGGMKQKLALSCALLHTPELLLLDEPTNGVDPLSRQEFWEILHQLVYEEEVTIFISTSYMEEADKCSHVGFLYEGKILLRDTPNRLRNSFKKTIFQIESDRSRTLAMQLSEEFPLATIFLFGKKIRIITTEKEKIEMEIPKFLKKTENITVSSPTIEDIYRDKLQEYYE